MIGVVMTFAQVGKRLSKLLRYRACCWILHQGFVVVHRGEYIKKSWEGSAQKSMLRILSDFTDVTIYSAMLGFSRRGFGWATVFWGEMSSILQVLQKSSKLNVVNMFFHLLVYVP